MAVPSSNIALNGDINAEVASVNSGSLTTLSVNAIPAKSAPHGMQEFAGYQHTQNFGSSVYQGMYGNSNSSTPYRHSQTTATVSTSGTYGITAFHSCEGIDNFFAFAQCGYEINVMLNNNGYLYVYVRFKSTSGISSAANRRLYRTNGAQQTNLNLSQNYTMGYFTNVGGFVPNSAGNQYGIFAGSATNYLNTGSGTGGSVTGSSGSSTYGSGAFYSLSGQQSVGASYEASASAQSILTHTSYTHTYDNARIFNIKLRRSGYYDTTIGGVMVRAKAVATSYRTGGEQP